MGQQGAANLLKLSPASQGRGVGWGGDVEAKFRHQLAGGLQLGAPPDQNECWCADWKLLHTKHADCGFLRSRACVGQLQSPRWLLAKRTGSVSGLGPPERWKDNFAPTTTITVSGPHAASNYLWALTEPDWFERIWVGNFKSCSCFCGCERICITHSGLMDFPMFTLDSRYCRHLLIMNLLCVEAPFPPVL